MRTCHGHAANGFLGKHKDSPRVSQEANVSRCLRHTARISHNNGQSFAQSVYRPPNFRHYFTLLSECFSTFAQATCLLSVSLSYLVLEVCTLPTSHKVATLCYSPLLSHAIHSPRAHILRRQCKHCQQQHTARRAEGQGDGISLTLKRILFENTASPLSASWARTSQLPAKGFKVELCPFHSPLLRTSHLISFLPRNKMLQFSGFSNVPQDTKQGKKGYSFLFNYNK